MDFSYEVFPKVVSHGSETEISVRGLFPESSFAISTQYKVRLSSKVNKGDQQEFEVKPNEETVRFSPRFDTKGEYEFDIFSPDIRHRPILTGHIFAIDEEIMGYKPFKGDMHIHTFYSDGKQSPIYMAAKGKSLGLDFLSITDHHKYHSSLEAIREANKIGLDMLIVRGEEISSREACGHVVSLNANSSVADYRDDSTRYDAEVARIAEEFRNTELVDGLTPEHYAHAVWTIRKVRDFGGFAVIAHPYWVSSGRFDLDRRVYEQLLNDQLYDAIELFGDVEFEDNMLSLVRYAAELHSGKTPPIIGNSDTHRADRHTYGGYWTMVFADELTTDSILSAISDGRSVACQRCPGNGLIAFGPFHLVEYTYFLHREFFPIHDRICEIQGMLFLRMLEGKKIPHDGLNSLKSELQEIYAKLLI
jgi:predicted metal-dependent phosphoesterase TrpH